MMTSTRQAAPNSVARHQNLRSQCLAIALGAMVTAGFACGQRRPAENDGSTSPSDGATESAGADASQDMTPPRPEILCTKDVTVGGASTGSRPVLQATDIIPLCSGWLYIAEPGASRVALMNGLTGEIAQSYPVKGDPRVLALDAQNELIHVVMHMSKEIARIDLKTGTTSYLPPLPLPASQVAQGDGGLVFVYLVGDSGLKQSMAYIDGPAAQVKKVKEIPYLEQLPGSQPLLAWDTVKKQLLLANMGISGGSLVRLSFDATALDTSTTQQIKSGGNGQDLRVSPDGKHVAYPCGSGNGNGNGNGKYYTIHDFNSQDLNKIFGEWDTGPYPRSADFSPDGKLLAASNGVELMVFSATQHAVKKQSHKLGPTDLFKVRFSKGGRLVFALRGGPSSTKTTLHWVNVQP